MCQLNINFKTLKHLVINFFKLGEPYLSSVPIYICVYSNTNIIIFHYFPGEEDCLHLNIYTPRIDQKARLNVIIFVHGGAFMFNHGTSYGSKIILDRDIVYVTFNYRLGPLGFLSTEDTVVPGNNGIRDQILALRWIKDNIVYFGGNPESITVTGMSAGGASVQLYYISPLTKG